MGRIPSATKPSGVAPTMWPNHKIRPRLVITKAKDVELSGLSFPWKPHQFCHFPFVASHHGRKKSGAFCLNHFLGTSISFGLVLALRLRGATWSPRVLFLAYPRKTYAYARKKEARSCCLMRIAILLGLCLACLYAFM